MGNSSTSFKEKERHTETTGRGSVVKTSVLCFVFGQKKEYVCILMGVNRQLVC
jgi:hypothetical protein